jgi:hypothetical protein
VRARKTLALATFSAITAACSTTPPPTQPVTAATRSLPTTAASLPSTSTTPTADHGADLPGRAPAPFTTDALRDALVPGRTFELVVETADGLPARERVRVFLADARQVSIATQRLDDDELPVGAPEARTLTWPELRATWSFPSESTTIAVATIDTPFGSFAGRRYTTTLVEDGHRVVRTFAFVDTVPGVPVEELVQRDGAFVRSTTLLSVSSLPPPTPANAP